MTNNKALTQEEIQQQSIKVKDNNKPQNAINLKGQNQNQNNNNTEGQYGTTPDANVTIDGNDTNISAGDKAALIAAGQNNTVQGQAPEASQSPEKQQGIRLLDLGGHQNQEAARLLDYYLNIANPVYREVENEIITRDVNGNESKRTVRQRVLEGYEYYNVNGVPLKDWIIEQFGPDYKLNTKNNTVEKISNE